MNLPKTMKQLQEVDIFYTILIISAIPPSCLPIMRYFFCNSCRMLFMVLLCSLSFTLFKICVTHSRSMAQKGGRVHGSPWISYNCEQCLLPGNMAISISTQIYVALALCIFTFVISCDKTLVIWYIKCNILLSRLKKVFFTLSLSCELKM